MTQPIQNPKSKTCAERSRSIQNPFLVLLLLLYLIVALAHARLAPLTTGPDELAHYEYVRFIAENGRLPLDNKEREQASYKSDQPPLYHLLAALPAALVDATGPPYLKRISDHNRRQLIERTRHSWGLYNTEDEQWPPQAEILRWQVGRWVAILFGAATVAVTFFMARDLFVKLSPPAVRKDQQGLLLAFGAAAVVAFIPRFALTGSMLNYETTLAFFTALFLWLLLRIANGQSGDLRFTIYDLRFTIQALLLGLFTGLAITTKLSAIILPLEILAALWLIGRRKGWSWTTWLRAVSITAAGALAVMSWWWGFILYQFNTIARDGWWTGSLRPLVAADASDATTNRLLNMLTGGQAGFTGAIENLNSGPPWEWLAIFFRSFWVVGIEGFQPLGLVGLTIALLLCLLAAVGLVSIWRRSAPGVLIKPIQTSTANTFDNRLVLNLLLLHLAIPFILPLLRYAATFSLADTAQGRHILFLAAPAFAILLVWGLGEAVSGVIYQVSHSKSPIPNPQSPIPNLQSPITNYQFLIPGLFLLFWSGVQLWHMTWAYHPLLPVSTMPQAKAQAGQQLYQTVNEYMTLVGFNRQLDDEGRALRLDLIWQATAISPLDYLIELSLLDEQGDLQRQWLGYSANGRYPTRAWDEGDIVRDTAWLPLEGLAPDTYSLSLNLITSSLNQPGPVFDVPLTLAAIDLPSPAPPPLAAIQVWQNGQILAMPKPFRYRETILISLNLSGPERMVQIVGPGPGDTKQLFDPVRDLGDSVLFIVGPDWPTGDYELQISPRPAAENDESQLIGPVFSVVDRWQREFTQPPLSHIVEANFANRVKLLGYDLGANRAEPGGGIPATLYWQGLDWMGHDYTIFTKLLAADQTVHGGRDRLPQEGYSTLYWAPGEIIVDPFGAPVDADAPDGIYYLNVGLYKQVGEQAISLPLVQNGQPIEATSVNIGPLKIGSTPPGLTLETANPQAPLNKPFGDIPNLTLLGYDLTNETGQSIKRSPNLQLTLYWRSEFPLPIDYTTFVHLRNAAGKTVAQKDQPPLNGAYPTSLWDPGEIIADKIAVPLPPKLPAGEYSLVIGMYDFNTGLRLTVPDNPENSLILNTMDINP